MISLGEITSKKYSSFLRGPRVPILFWYCFSNYSFKYPNLFWYKEKCQITSSCASKIATLGPYPVLDTMCQYYFWIRSLISTKSKQVHMHLQFHKIFLSHAYCKIPFYAKGNSALVTQDSFIAFQNFIILISI